MSMDLSSERVCYVHCNFCNTVLAVSVPYSSLSAVVTVRCGCCANLLSLNMGLSLHQNAAPIQETQTSSSSEELRRDYGGSSSKGNIYNNVSISIESGEREAPRTPPIRPPEKRQRVPSAYNRFIKEEIQRIKASNPEITHREAFSTAAKNWAHFPHIHFGLKLDGNTQGRSN